MKFIITQRKGEISPETREYVEKKLLKLEKYFSKDAIVNITFDEQRERKIVEVTIFHAGIFFRAEYADKDALAAIDKIIDILERQIRRHKTKLEKKLRSNAFDGIKSDPETTYEVSRRKKFKVESCTIEDAILQMEMLGHNFFFFKNLEENDKPCVLYVRKNGGYGILEE